MSEELAKLQRALAADPADIEARKALGNAYRASGDLAAAMQCYRECLARAPDFEPALYNLGAAAREAGLLDEAEACFQRLCQLAPDDADARYQLGSLLLEQERPAEAVAPLEAALALQPGHPVLHWMLGAALASQERLAEARPHLEKAVALEPALDKAWLHLGNVYSLLRLRAEAVRCYLRAHETLAGDPACTEALLFELQHVCDWRRLDGLVEQRRRDVRSGAAPAANPFSFVSICEAPAEQLACGRLFAAPLERRANALRARLGLRFAAPDRGRRIRLGYLSADFHEHPTAYLAAELFELHDRQAFELVAYSYGRDDESPVRQRLRAAFHRFVDLRGMSDADAARAIHRDGIDILVDLKGYTAGARPGLVALRPAPLQVSYLGYPATLGAAFVDYVVLDSFIASGATPADFSEKLVVLPGCYQPNDRTRPVPARAGAARRALGLPAEGVVLCCFNQPYKILPGVFGAWMRVLREAPQATLWLLEWNSQARDNLRAAAAECGVDPSRLVFSPLVPASEHLARIPAADLFLDTYPCNAHTTASDALWAGVPVLTRAGSTFASRVAGSLLVSAGLPELVTHSAEDYERRATALANDPGALEALRRRAEAARAGSVLFDTPRLARSLEAAYQEMWARHCAGRGPAEIRIRDH